MPFKFENIPRIDLCILPTPIMPLPRLSDELGGPQIYMKRDDLTGVAFGGNKNRKLEFLLADALEGGADVIVTEGAITSNHCLQTAACAAKLGLGCELVLSGTGPTEVTGNYFLFHILGVKIQRVDNPLERKSRIKQVETNLKSNGKKPYIIPTGGSNAIGALGYINCISEVVRQAKEMEMRFDYFVHGAGSSGTQAGLLIGKQIYFPELEVVSISAGESVEFLTKEAKLIIQEFDSRYSFKGDLKRIPVKVVSGYEGAGYGLPSNELIDTIKMVARLEGVFLDPVYNGKAMVALIDMIRSKNFDHDQNILFLNSGGGPSIFNYRKVFV